MTPDGPDVDDGCRIPLQRGRQESQRCRHGSSLRRTDLDSRRDHAGDRRPDRPRSSIPAEGPPYAVRDRPACLDGRHGVRYVAPRASPPRPARRASDRGNGVAGHVGGDGPDHSPLAGASGDRPARRSLVAGGSYAPRDGRRGQLDRNRPSAAEPTPRARTPGARPVESTTRTLGRPAARRGRCRRQHGCRTSLRVPDEAA